jgi:hypothetical protein
MKIVRFAPDEFFVRERPDVARLDQNHVVGILHFAFGKLNVASRTLAANLGRSLCLGRKMICRKMRQRFALNEAPFLLIL